MINPKNIIEALLLAAAEPLPSSKFIELLQPEITLTAAEIEQILNDLAIEYQDRGIELKNLHNGYRVQTRTEISSFIARMYAEKPPRYSRVLLEVLAIVVYRQPITKGEIEDIRGVSVSSSTMKSLLEYGWIKIAGYKNVPGKPPIYITTSKFLDYFNLQSLQQLPPFPETAIESNPENPANAQLELNLQEQDKSK